MHTENQETPAPIIGPLFDYEARIISLLGPIDFQEINLIVDQLLRLDAASEKEITLFLSSQGSNLLEILKVTDCIQLMRSKLTIVGLGLIEGPSALLLASAPRRILLRSAFGSTAGFWSIPDLHPAAKACIGLQSKSREDFMPRLVLDAVHVTLDTASPSTKSILLKPDADARIMNASECIAVGLADAIVNGPQRLLHKSKNKRIFP